MAWWRDLFRRSGNPAAKAERWHVLQIEVTSRCPLRCTFCPNKALGKNWVHGDLPWATFRDCIAPHLARFDLVYLQGWGEPLVHPHLWEMVRATKAAGCRVGFTTCGSLLDEANSTRLLDEGIDILSISFAGANPATHESLRVGSTFRALAANVERVARLKKERVGLASSQQTVSAMASPIVELHFLMQRTNIHELPDFVRLSAQLGADEVVATNVAYAPTREIEAGRVFAESPDPNHLALIAAAETEARRLGMKFRAYPLAMDPNVLECDAQPTETAFVNHLGQVTPCVYAGLPVKDKVPRVFNGQDCSFAPINFGNVDAGLLAAWQGVERAKFTSAWRARRAFAYSALALSAADGMSARLDLPAPPLVCQSCNKLYGI